MQAEQGQPHYPFEMADPQSLIAHPWVVVVLTPFILIFLWAAWLEFRRWWLYGPSQNKRANFPIDEHAPSYEPPAPESGTSGRAGDRLDHND